MRLMLTLFSCFISLAIFAQTNPYQADLTQLRAVLQKTPSYKDQITGDKLVSYNELYARLAADTVSNPGDFKYFYNLTQLLFPIRDNHIGFYQLALKEFRTEEDFNNYIQSKEFSLYPRYEINIDSLKEVLSRKPASSIEGIYHYDKYYSVGLFKINEKEYIGVVTDAETPLWTKGQIAMHLYEYEPGLYKAIYGHPVTKNFIYEGNERYVNQSLVRSTFYGSWSDRVYSKQLKEADHVNLPRGGRRFQMKNINKDVQYLLIRTFQANNTAVQESNNFYDSIKNLITAPNLIVDLRNNEGGAGRLTRKYFDLINEFTKKGTVYVLLNHSTLSQAEIFTLNLKRLKNVVTVGQTTKGMLAYGSNYDYRTKLPSQQFEIYPTDMRGGLNLLQYECYGIDPDITLDSNSDWIEQVVLLINRKLPH